MKILSSAYEWLCYVLRRVLALVEFVLLTRLVVRFLGANPEAFVAKYFYRYTDYLIWPFRNIYPDYLWQGRAIDIVTVAAMVGYAVAFFILFRLLKLFSRE